MSPDFRDDRSARLTVAAAFGTALFALVCAPLLATGWSGDDIFNSTIDARMAIDHQTWAQAVDGFDQSWRAQGRFFPLTLYFTYGVLHVFNDLHAYKAFEVAMLALNGVTFAVLVRVLTGSTAVGVAALPLCAAIFQLRLYNDAYLGFATLLPAVLEILLLSIILFVLALRTGSGRVYAGSLLAFVLCLLTYEISYLFSAVHAVLAWRSGRLRRCAPFLAASAAFVALSLEVRKHAKAMPGDSAYSIHFDPVQYARTLGDQLVAAIPTTFALFDPYGWLGPVAGLVTGLPWAFAAALVILSAAAVWSLWYARDATRAPVDVRTIVLVGLATWISPALLIPLSPKYQLEIVPGIAHLPVYVESFGFALVVVGAGLWLSERIPKRGTGAALAGTACALAVVLVVGSAANARVLAHNENERLARDNMTVALRDGVLRGLPSGATVYVAGGSLIDKFPDARFLYAQAAGTNVTVRPLAALDRCATRCAAPTNAFVLLARPVGRHGGYAVAGRIVQTYAGTDGAHALLEGARIFVRGDAATLERADAAVEATAVPCRGEARVSADEEPLRTLSPRASADGVLYTRRPVCPMLDAASIVPRRAAGASARERAAS